MSRLASVDPTASPDTDDVDVLSARRTGTTAFLEEPSLPSWYTGSQSQSQGRPPSPLFIDLGEVQRPETSTGDNGGDDSDLYAEDSRPTSPVTHPATRGRVAVERGVISNIPRSTATPGETPNLGETSAVGETSTIGETHETGEILKPPEKSAKFVRCQQFFLTLNQVDQWDVIYTYLTTRGSTIKYLLAVPETAPSTGHPHIHCYVWYYKHERLYLDHLPGCDIQRVKGRPWQVVEYLLKTQDEEGFEILKETGDRPQKPKWIKEGRCNAHKAQVTAGDVVAMTEDELLQLTPAQYLKAKQVRLQEEDRAWSTKGPYYKKIPVVWIAGPSGVGKTRWCVEHGATMVTYENGFFSDWGDARIIAFEEFRGQIPYPKFLQITDSYHGYYKVNIKGGHKRVDFDAVYITSPLLPQDCYPRQNQKDSLDQLMRRITETRKEGPDEWWEQYEQRKLQQTYPGTVPFQEDRPRFIPPESV